jgi:diacylglycerol kinase (CTP)
MQLLAADVGRSARRREPRPRSCVGLCEPAARGSEGGVTTGPTAAATAPTATRHDLQLGRRLIHLANGVAIATAYAVLFTHEQIVHVFGVIACVAYIADRVRIHYPELVARLPWLNRAFFRAEEELKESAMIPYAIAVLLTILTFPKVIALIAIYTLGISDPASAIVGITWGRRRIVPGKSVEGSLAFLVATAVIAAVALGTTSPASRGAVALAAVLIGLAGAVLEMLPLRIDDNLTIPVTVGFASWIVCALVGVPV